MLFESGRLYVVKWKEENLTDLYDLFNDAGIKEFIAPKLTLGETEYIFQKQLLDYQEGVVFGRYFIVGKSTGKFIGLLLLKEVDNKCSVEIGYSLIKEEWKKGFATEIVNETVNWLFKKRFSKICAITELENVDSQNVLYKAGFKRQNDFEEEGKMMSYFLHSKQEM